jgi:hypothetical protein
MLEIRTMHIVSCLLVLCYSIANIMEIVYEYVLPKQRHNATYLNAPQKNTG